MSTLYRVGTFREAGLDARWTKTYEGEPYIALRDSSAPGEHQRVAWWCCDDSMLAMMEREGIREGFRCATTLGAFFSITKGEA